MAQLTDAGQPLTFWYFLALVFVVQGPAIAIFIVLSATCEVAYSVYYGLATLVPIGWAFLVAGGAGLFVLHALNWYNWTSAWLKIPAAVIVVYVLAVGGLCYTMKYPAVPLMLALTHFLIVMGATRVLTAGRLSSRAFYQGMAISCAITALWVFIGWIAWIATSNMSWSWTTKARLHLKMRRIFELYGVPDDWSMCISERSKVRDQDVLLLTKCKELEQMTFLIWVCPLIEAGVLLALSIIAYARSAISARLKGEDQESDIQMLERQLKVIMLMVAMALTGIWMGVQTMGASMGLSNLYLASLVLCGVFLGGWILNSFNVELISKTLSNSVLWKLAKPFLVSDWFYAFILCFTLFPMILALLVEVFVRMLERLRRVPGESPWITDRGLWLCQLIQSKHWASCLEKCFMLCCTYFVMFIFDKFTAVFLGWLNGKLMSLHYAAVCGIFYVTGICLFAFPPLPGVPVYLAGGVIVANQGKAIMGLPGAIAFACLLATIQKCNAVTLHQVLLGRQFGKSPYVQQLVGVHTPEIRAIEKILTVPHLTLDKIYILCGGPDWPVSVLTGILGLSVVGVFIGTFPSFVLIAPCVIAGACLMDEQLSPMSPVITMVVGITQGGLLLAALIATAREAEKSHAELAIPKPEHAPLIKLAEAAEQKQQRYKQKTSWERLHCGQKFTLLASVALLHGSCGILTIVSSLAFRNFELGNDIGASFEDGGLNGSVLNVVKWPLGVAGVVLVGAGVVFYIMYVIMTACARGVPVDPVDPVDPVERVESE